MIWSLVIDSALIVLLAITLGYAFALNRKLTAVRLSQAEFDHRAEAFTQAAVRAEESVSRLKVSASGARDVLDRAEQLTDDLRDLIERGSKVADRLEADVSASRQAEAALRRPVRPAVKAAAPAPVAPEPAAERAPSMPERKPSPRRTPLPERSPLPVGEGGLEVSRAAFPPAPKTAPRVASASPMRPRSQAERNLLEALRAAGIASE